METIFLESLGIVYVIIFGIPDEYYIKCFSIILATMVHMSYLKSPMGIYYHVTTIAVSQTVGMRHWTKK